MSSADTFIVAADLATQQPSPLDDSPSSALSGCGVSSPRMGTRSVARTPILASSSQKRTPVVLAASDPKRLRIGDSENAAVPVKDQNNPDTEAPLQSGNDALATLVTAAPAKVKPDADALAAKKARRAARKEQREQREEEGLFSVPTAEEKKGKRRKREILDADTLLERLGQKYPNDPETVPRPPCNLSGILLDLGWLACTRAPSNSGFSSPSALKLCLVRSADYS